MDIVWLDFGQGEKVGQFIDKVWSRIRPGGLVLCHSTLTNSLTRDWLEKMRARVSPVQPWHTTHTQVAWRSLFGCCCCQALAAACGLCPTAQALPFPSGPASWVVYVTTRPCWAPVNRHPPFLLSSAAGKRRDGCARLLRHVLDARAAQAVPEQLFYFPETERLCRADLHKIPLTRPPCWCQQQHMACRAHRAHCSFLRWTTFQRRPARPLN